jgi:hypothetical protein
MRYYKVYYLLSKFRLQVVSEQFGSGRKLGGLKAGKLGGQEAGKLIQLTAHSSLKLGSQKTNKAGKLINGKQMNAPAC